MVTPKTIGPDKIGTAKQAGERRHDIEVMVPVKNVVRKVEAFDATPAPGVQEIITSDNSSFRFLRFARIILDGSSNITRSLAKEEAVYYVNRGSATVEAEGESHTLGKGDVVYVGIDSTVKLSGDADVSEFKAIQCHTKYPVQLVRHTDIEGTPLAA